MKFHLLATSVLLCNNVNPLMSFSLSQGKLSQRNRFSSSKFNTHDTFSKRQTKLCPLSMHMGHSHSHSHGHHHDHNHNHNHNHNPQLKLPSVKKTLRILLITFLTTIVPRFILAKQITKSDTALSILIATGLFLSQNIQRTIQGFMTKLRVLYQGIMAHIPISKTNFRQASYNYLFKNKNSADRVTLLGAVVNILLSIGKFAVGITCHSAALVADAGHSLSDLFSDFITLWACQVARLPPDEDHPYGHGKFEAIGSLFLALTLLGTGISVGIASNSALMSVIAMQRSCIDPTNVCLISDRIPTPPALIAAGVSILSKEWLFRITKKVGEKLNSPIVIANAWHHRSDAFSSILALVSIGLAIFVPSLVAADSIAGILVAAMICTTGLEILGQSLHQLTDSNNKELVQRVSHLTSTMSDDILSIKRIRARQVGSKALVDIVISTSDTLSASAITTLEEMLRYRILQQEAEYVLDVEVHATNDSNVVCPALLATVTHQLTNQTMSTSSSTEPHEHDHLHDHSHNQLSQHEHESSASASALSSPPLLKAPATIVSAAHVEEIVRNEILQSSSAPQFIIPNIVKGVHSITVHYHDTILIDVDVIIQLDTFNHQQTTIKQINHVGNTLKHILEKTEHVHKANIYLNLDPSDTEENNNEIDNNVLQNAFE